MSHVWSRLGSLQLQQLVVAVAATSQLNQRLRKDQQIGQLLHAPLGWGDWTPAHGGWGGRETVRRRRMANFWIGNFRISGTGWK
jgi:hypothetical protein